MFTLVSDIESYPRFLPWCRSSRVLSQDNDEVRASIEFSVSGMTRSFTTRNRHQVNKIIEMQLVDGPFSRLDGCWQFGQLGEAGSKISLFMEYDFENRVLGMVVGPVFSQIANTLVDSFQKRAVEVYGAR
jgi:ribosome-associated toxin RatA of RatAB toxin-antitoxin module